MSKTPKQNLLIGRDAELKKLQKIYRDIATSKKSQVVLIEGELGVGKTALVEHFFQTLTDPKGNAKAPLIGIGKCTLESQMVGLQPFKQMLSSLGNDKSFEITIGNVFQFINSIAPAWADVFTQGAASKTVKALSTSFTSAGDSFAQEQKLNINLTYTEFAKILNKISEKRMVIGFIDDFHWADESSVGLLSYLADSQNIDGFNESPIMIIVSYRPFMDEEIGNLFRKLITNESNTKSQITKIKFPSGISAREYINTFYSNNDLSEPFFENVETHSKGNPLLLKQLFSYLELNNDLSKQEMANGSISWKASSRLSSPDFIQKILKQSVSDSIGAVLFERYRLLQDKELELYETLSFASVEGEYFSAQIIAALRGKSLEDVFRSLQKLENIHQLVIHAEDKIIDINGQSLDTYHFNPLILRDIIYEDLAPGQRKYRHQQVAEYLEKFSEYEKNAPQLAIQFQNAQDNLKAGFYALKAAQYEQSQSKIAEAENWCVFGLNLLDRISSKDVQELRLDLRKTIADGYFFSGKHEDAANKYHELLTSKDIEAFTPEKIAEIFVQAAHACILKGDSNQRSVEYCLQGKAYLRNIPFSQYYFALEVNYIKARNIEKKIKIELFKALLEYGETLKDEPYLNKHLSLGHKWMGTEYLDLGEYKEAVKCYQDSINFAKKCANKDLEAQSILNLADLCGETGDFDAGLRYADDGYKLSLEINEIDNLAYSLAIQGNIYLQKEDYLQALEKLQKAINDSIKIGSHWNLPFMCADMAICLLETGRDEEALEYAKKAIESQEDEVKYGYALCAMGRVTERLFGKKDSQMYFEESLEKLRIAGHKNFYSQTKYYLAEALLKTRDNSVSDQVSKLLQEAYADFEALGIKHRMEMAANLLSKRGLV